jgi:hypothetical protein
MLWTIFVILLVLWLLGLVTFHALGAYVHILLVLAIIVLIIQLITGRRGALYRGGLPGRPPQQYRRGNCRKKQNGDDPVEREKSSVHAGQITR